ncbi:aldose epimerase family protein [Alteromonas gracilis]|uniref:aldose epimerase family protein n=1 Tax=Alteromonas gracilis TaxID=1479524 RepID=UPI00321A892E
MNIEITKFGEIGGDTVNKFTLTNANGMQVELLNFGGIIKAITLTDAYGARKNCVQGLASLDDYIQDTSYLGAIVGRYANRIGNATFTLDGTQYLLDKNGGEHNLHGGNAGFHKKVWNATSESTNDELSVTLQLTSPDGEGGFPGNVNVTARYTLDNNDTLTLVMTADTDKATPLSFTQHAYFTLSNEATIGTTQLYIDAENVTEADASLLPTGNYVDVKDTPFDFRELIAINERANASNPIALYKMVGGYDHNYVLRDAQEGQPQARVLAKDTGIAMSLYTSLPGLQFYTGNLETSEQLGSLCLEPQHFPDAPNKPQFPNAIVRPGEPIQMVMRYAFSVKK